MINRKSYIKNDYGILLNCTPHNITLDTNVVLFPSGYVISASLRNIPIDYNPEIVRTIYMPSDEGLQEIKNIHILFKHIKMYCLSSTITVKAYSINNPYMKNIHIVGMIQLNERGTEDNYKKISSKTFYIL